MKILIRRINKNLPMPKIIKKGDWIDLYCSQDMEFISPQAGIQHTLVVNGVEGKYRDVTFDKKMVPLGVAMLLPDGMEAILANRSGTGFKNNISIINGIGVIDGGEEGYNGNDDEWKYPAVAWEASSIKEGKRICQFRIQLSQKATMWQKIKWLFSSSIELVEVDTLPTYANRGGGGTTGDENFVETKGLM